MKQEDMTREILANRVSMMRFALSITQNGADAEDAVSEAVLRALKKCGSLRENARAKCWLFTITHRAALDILRRRKRELPQENLPETGESPLIDGEGGISAEIGRLPYLYRQALTLYYYDDMKLRDIARALGEKESTVAMRIKRGRDALRKALEQEGEL